MEMFATEPMISKDDRRMVLDILSDPEADMFGEVVCDLAEDCGVPTTHLRAYLAWVALACTQAWRPYDWLQPTSLGLTSHPWESIPAGKSPHPQGELTGVATALGIAERDFGFALYKRVWRASAGHRRSLVISEEVLVEVLSRAWRLPRSMAWVEYEFKHLHREVEYFLKINQSAPTKDDYQHCYGVSFYIDRLQGLIPYYESLTRMTGDLRESLIPISGPAMLIPLFTGVAQMTPWDDLREKRETA